ATMFQACSCLPHTTIFQKLPSRINKSSVCKSTNNGEKIMTSFLLLSHPANKEINMRTSEFIVTNMNNLRGARYAHNGSKQSTIERISASPSRSLYSRSTLLNPVNMRCFFPTCHAPVYQRFVCLM